MADVALRVFVSDLPFETTAEQLKAHMSSAGRVTSVNLMQSRGRPSGAGIVVYSSAAEANAARATLHGTDLGGRHIIVREDRDAALLASGTKSVFVRNLPWSVTDDQLKAHFTKAGTVEKAEVYTFGKRSAGMGLVTFVGADSAQRAIDTLNNTEIDGRPISVRVDRGARDPDAARPARRSRPAGGAGAGAAGAAGAARPPRAAGGDAEGAAGSGRRRRRPRGAANGVAGRVIMSGFAAGTAAAELRAFAERAGPVATSTMIRDMFVVDYADPAHALEAQRTLSTAPLGGVKLKVTLGSEGAPAPAPAAAAAPRRAKAPAADLPLDAEASRRVYCSNLPFTITDTGLRQYMASAGAVKSVQLLNLRGGRPAGSGLVTYATPEEAKMAIDTLNETMFEGRALRLRLDKLPLKATA